MKRWIKDNAAFLFLVSAVIYFAGVALLWGRPAGTDDARFMLECVSDFQYKPETCRAILAGEDPPQVPDALGEPGC